MSLLLCGFLEDVLNTDYIVIAMIFLASVNMEYYTEPRLSLMPMSTGVLCSLMYWNGFVVFALLFFLVYTSFFYLINKDSDRG